MRALSGSGDAFTGARPALEGTKDSLPMKVMTRGAGDVKRAQMVPTESQILTESLTGMAASLRG